jgi:hypothetical protein
MGRLLTAPTVLLLLALGAAGCRTEPDPDAAAPEAPAAPAPPADEGPAPSDALEPPETVVEIAPRPAPPPAPDPEPAPPPPPPASGPSGSCDVRATEGFCFTYTGPGWTPREAAANCDAAPGARFGPGTCPLDGRVAACAFRRPSAPDREIVYTYYAPYDLGLAELACPGAFTRLE